MSRIDQQLIDLSYQIEVLKSDRSRSREQFESIEEQAEDAKIRSIVSESPDQAKFSHDMDVARNRLAKVIDDIDKEIEALKEKQNDLLEKLFEENQTTED